MDRSPLARLAPEIRNRIYEYTFSSIYAVTLRSGACEHPLTQTCAQIRFETLQMFFATGTFNAHLDDDHTTSLAAWLSALGSEKLHWVNKIQIWDIHDLRYTVYGSRKMYEADDDREKVDKPWLLFPVTEKIQDMQLANVVNLKARMSGHHQSLLGQQELDFAGILVALRGMSLTLAHVCFINGGGNEPEILALTSNLVMIDADAPIAKHPE